LHRNPIATSDTHVELDARSSGCAHLFWPHLERVVLV
jgi:hypothetical protein